MCLMTVIIVILCSDCIVNLLLFPSEQKENLSESSFITDSDPNLCRSDANASGTNITFKSFTCVGGEVEISDRSDLSDQSVLITHNSPHTLNNTTVTHKDTEGEHEDHPYCTYTTDGKQEDHVTSGNQSLSRTNSSDVTFKSFTCTGGEVEIAGNESIVSKDPDLENPTQSFEDEVSEHTELPGHHFDHLYCNTQTSELRSGKMEEDGGAVNHAFMSISKNATGITFKSFTCPGGEVEISEESLVQSESLMKNESLIANDSELQNLQSEICDEHTELPSRHFDHPYCNTQTSELRSGKMEEDSGEDGVGGSVIHLSISKNVTDVTFKSFACPGGEVEIAEESLAQFDSIMKNESVVQDESLVPKDSELQNLQSETCDEHTELPSCHFDHPYCSDETESSTCIGKGSVMPSTMLDTNKPEGVITINDSSSALKGSTATDRRDDVTILSSGAEVEIENMYRMFDTPMLTKGLNIYHPAKSSPSTELSEHGGESIIVSEKDGHIYCHVVKNHPQVTVSENDAHLSVQISRSGVWERSEGAVSYEGSENMKSEMMVPEGSSDTTEVQNVKSVQQQDLDQDVCSNLEENVLKDENTRLRCDEVFSDENGEISHSQPGVDRISENFGSAETKNVQKHNMISQNAHDANVSTHSDPEVLRSESVDVEARMKMWSHIILSEPSTPKHSALGHLWLSESPIPPPQLHSTVLAAPLTPKPAPSSDHELQKEKVMKDFSAVGKGPLQDQLRKMGELLIAASGKISAPAAVTPVQQHSACVWTTPTPQQERSTNTSAIMEERKEIDVSDACTSTDSLLWR